MSSKSLYDTCKRKRQRVRKHPRVCGHEKKKKELKINPINLQPVEILNGAINQIDTQDLYVPTPRISCPQGLYNLFLKVETYPQKPTN